WWPRRPRTVRSPWHVRTYACRLLRMTAPPHDVPAEEVVRRGADVRTERVGVGTITRRIRVCVLHAVDDPRLDHVAAVAVVVRRDGVGVAALEAHDAARTGEVVVVH